MKKSNLLISLLRSISLLLAFSLLLGSCSESSTPTPSYTLTDENIELYVSTITGPVAEKLKVDAAAFSLKYPNVTFKFTEFEPKIYEDQGPRLFQSDDKPDVAWFWMLTRTYALIESEAFEPLDDLYAREGWDKVLPQSTIELFTYKDGKKYGANDTIVWAPTLYYNKDILVTAGVEAPKTIEDLYIAAQKIKAAGFIPLVSGVGTPNIAGHMFEGVLSHTLNSDQYAKIIDFSKKYNDMNYESQAMVDVFSTLQRIGKELLPDGAAGTQDNEARAMFVQGKAAFYSQGSWAAGSALLGKELSAEFKLGTMYYPQMKADVKGAVGLFAGNALWVIKGTGKEAWSKEFVAYAMSKESHIALVKSKGLFPSRTDLSATDLVPLGSTQINMYNQLKDAGTVTYWHHLAPVELNQVKNEVVQSIISGEITPADAVKKLQKTFDETLK
jgi:ABC-type glycerol-3-phosphate transport system substrate-binding protein